MISTSRREELGISIQPPPSFIRDGFDIPLLSLSAYMAEEVRSLVEGGAIEGMSFGSQCFVRYSELIHYIAGDWEPG